MNAENVFTGQFRGIGVRSVKFCIPKQLRVIPASSLVWRSAAICALGVALSACVSATLNPGSDITPPVMSLANPDSTQTAQLEPQTNAQDTPQTPQNRNFPEGVTVPTTKPVAELVTPPAQPSTAQLAPAQLALANTGTSTSVAGSKTAAMAAAKPVSAGLQPTPAIAPQAVAKPPKSVKKGFFASLFGSNKRPIPPRSIPNTKNPARANNRRVAVFRPATKAGLPGVRKMGLFGIFEAREGSDEGYGAPVLMASAGGLARTSPNGLRIQHAGVQVACLQPALVSIIKRVQRRYGRVPIITSGYRSPSRNRKARGARNSMHIYCKAADIQVAGISKWALAKYLRSIPGRGGVGTYCHTKSVHIDVGSKRDWNWRCRRRKRKR